MVYSLGLRAQGSGLRAQSSVFSQGAGFKGHILRNLGLKILGKDFGIRFVVLGVGCRV